ncbi:SDR family NAD(P)-dependent oxidoreductase [Microbacterium schleiferi]|uniref:SDR family NAD(P)-dependent oxidoreductase n=1 Tax=Microbacterium schleiferi TaxID=69362 RepID=UPI0035C7CD9C
MVEFDGRPTSKPRRPYQSPIHHVITRLDRDLIHSFWPITLNLRGTYLMCLAAVPVMRRQRYGRIINIESMAGVEGGAPADSAPETKGVTVSTM